MCIKLDVIDPYGKVPDWDLTSISPLKEKPTKNLYNWKKQEGKCSTKDSPEGYNRRKGKNITDQQIREFLWGFLEGTEMVPRYEDIEGAMDAGN